MNAIPGRDGLQPKESHQLKTIRWLLRTKATTGFRSPHFWILPALLAALAYIYYDVLTGFYDIYLVMFFYPLIYAAVVYRLRGVVICGTVTLGILLPHVLLLDEAYSLLRMLLFTLFAISISGLVATLLNYLEHQIEAYYVIIFLNEELNSYIENLESTRKQLIQAEKLNAIGQLAASVAHEINNPLGGILVYSKLLLRKLKGGSFDQNEAVESLNKIEAAVSHCSHIIRGLLDFSRQSEPAFGPVILSKIMRGVMALVGHQAEMNQVKVSISDMSSLPEITADAKQLQQVFINLVVNAIQAMPEGGELQISGLIGEDGWLRVSIRDTGGGITPENMDKLFTPFFSTKEKGKGTGLGLAVSYGIIERHGGRIEVASEPGKGSTFTVCLPVDIKREAGSPATGVSGLP